MEETIDISIDVFDQEDQRARVKTGLTVSGLIDEILKEFDDLDRKTPQAYALYLKGATRPLARERTLKELDIHAQDELIFRYARTSPRILLRGTRQAYLLEETTHKVFELGWVPAVIGRPNATDPAANELLAVNLEPFPDSKKISRRHAQITLEDGQFMIESLADNNPTYLNDEREPITGKRQLLPNTSIRLGMGVIVLTFIYREADRKSD